MVGTIFGGKLLSQISHAAANFSMQLCIPGRQQYWRSVCFILTTPMCAECSERSTLDRKAFGMTTCASSINMPLVTVSESLILKYEAISSDFL
jgi:hypothetical protein